MGGPNTLSFVVVAAFVPATLACFASLAPRRALLLTVTAGWLFLPAGEVYVVPPFKDSKGAFVCGVAFAASLLFDLATWRRLRPRPLDLAVGVLSLVPFASALSNDLGLYEALSATLQGVTAFGIPYLLGRAYLGSPRALDDLADAGVLAALAYVPFCLFELRMSPNLNAWIYGFSTSQFIQAIRGDAYRPIVFMGHPLMLALLMAVGTLLAYWQWRTKARRALLGVPQGWIVLVLLGATLLCRTAGALLLLVAGAAALEAARRLRTSALVVTLLLAPPLYCAARIAGWDAEIVVDVASEAISPERAASFAYRVKNEDLLAEKALQRPWLGWGRWGRSRVYDEEGVDIVVTDGLWIIVLGTSGFVGLLSLGGTLILPVAAFVRRLPAHRWARPAAASAAALAVGNLMFTADSVPNSMLNPQFLLAAGALASATARRRAAPAPRRAPAGVAAPTVRPLEVRSP